MGGGEQSLFVCMFVVLLFFLFFFPSSVMLSELHLFLNA